MNKFRISSKLYTTQMWFWPYIIYLKRRIIWPTGIIGGTMSLSCTNTSISFTTRTNSRLPSQWQLFIQLNLCTSKPSLCRPCSSSRHIGWRWRLSYHTSTSTVSSIIRASTSKLSGGSHGSRIASSMITTISTSTWTSASISNIGTSFTERSGWRIASTAKTFSMARVKR